MYRLNYVKIKFVKVTKHCSLIGQFEGKEKIKVNQKLKHIN